MAWIIRDGSFIMFAGVTGADALDKFISVTEKEPKSLRSKAVQTTATVNVISK